MSRPVRVPTAKESIIDHFNTDKPHLRDEVTVATAAAAACTAERLTTIGTTRRSHEKLLEYTHRFHGDYLSFRN